VPDRSRTIRTLSPATSTDRACPAFISESALPTHSHDFEKILSFSIVSISGEV